MNIRQRLFRNINSANVSIRMQLSRRVIILGIIAIFALLALLASALYVSMRNVQTNLDNELDVSHLAFTEFISGLRSDLLATSAALKNSNDVDLLLRRSLERQPAIFELILIDPSGKVVAHRRRVGINDLKFMAQPWLKTVKAGDFYIGPVDYKEYGLPFVDIAIAVKDNDGNFSGTLLAKTDFTSLWDLVTNIRIGKEGYAYIANGDGHVLAYRDINLVKNEVVVSNAIGHDVRDGLVSSFVVGLDDNYVAAANLPLKGGTSWYIVVEQPLLEAFAPFLQLLIVLAILLFVVVLQASSTIVFTRRRIVVPLNKLQEGVQEIKKRNLGVQIDIKTKDEFGTLAENFNAMAGEIKESITTLEQRIFERTRDLNIASNVSRQITRVLDMDDLLPHLAYQTREGFDLYFVSVFLYNQDTNELLLVAGTGAEGEKMKLEAKSFHINARPSLVAQAARERKNVIINDVKQAENYFNNPYLPETSSEAVFPMLVGEHLVGALDLQSKEKNFFGEEEIQIFVTLAEQIAVAVRNAELYGTQMHVAEELRRTDLMKSQFLASMSHELRTPLNAIINFTQLIAMGTAGPVTEDQKAMLNTSLGSSRHLLQLINDVLDISKIQAGKLSLYIEEDVNLYDEIKAVIGMADPLLQKQNALLEQSIQLIQDIDNNLPLIACDRRRIRQVLLNLLSNAIKFTDKGSITLSAKNRGAEIIFAVMDTGMGIAPEMQAQIFEPFVQTMDGIKHSQGTGLGLPISRNLIQAHGGELWIESMVGEGSTFFFTLPIHSLPTAE